LHQCAEQLCQTSNPVDQVGTKNTNRRSRDETRVVEVFDPDAALADTEWADHVRAVIRVGRDVATGTSPISSASSPASPWAQAIRQHWAIENRSHYVRDGSFRENASRIRCTPGIFARLRSFSTNVLRFNDVENVSGIMLGGLDALRSLHFM
jgi:hypothetical protein